MVRSALVAIALLACATSASAQIESALVRAGIAAYEALDYARAVTLLEKARAERLTIDETAAALQTLGFAKVALGDEDGARADFEALLRAAPETTLDRAVSPRIRVVFEEARAKVASEAPKPEPVKPAPEPPKPAVIGVRAEPSPAKEGEDVTVHLDAPPGLTALELSTRTRGEHDYRLQAVDPALPHVVLRGVPPALELFAVARGPDGAELARAGDASSPIAIPVEEAPAFYRKGWFWGVTGGVAGAAALAGVLIAVLAPKSDTALVVVPR